MLVKSIVEGTSKFVCYECFVHFKPIDGGVFPFQCFLHLITIRCRGSDVVVLVKCGRGSHGQNGQFSVNASNHYCGIRWNIGEQRVDLVQCRF